MNALLLNRDGFVMPEDGWYQLAPIGEFPHPAAHSAGSGQAGLIQVIDAEACEAMVARFKADSAGPNFAGLLVDFDHFSLDGEKRSEAAGWITGLEYRGRRAEGGNPACSRSEIGRAGRLKPESENAKPQMNTDGRGCVTGPAAPEGGQGSGGDFTTKVTKNTKPGEAGAGLWAKIRWSDVGEEAVKGGRYRFLSPVWARSDCVDLGDGRVRPVRLLNAAVTNDPNLKGMRPLSNRAQEAGFGVQGEQGKDLKLETGNLDSGELAAGVMANANTQRFKWVLGDSPEGRHCPSCAAVAGQVHTMAEWEAAGVKPGADGLFCMGTCHCRLEPTSEPSSGAVGLATGAGSGGVPLRNGGDGAGAVLQNIGWPDEARAASLAVRRAKASARRAPAKGSSRAGNVERDEKARKEDELRWMEARLAAMSPEEIEALATVAVRRAKARLRTRDQGEPGSGRPRARVPEGRAAAPVRRPGV